MLPSTQAIEPSCPLLPLPHPGEGGPLTEELAIAAFNFSTFPCTICFLEEPFGPGVERVCKAAPTSSRALSLVSDR
jgi:hypothetical protein